MVILLSDALIETGHAENLYYDFIQTMMIAYKEGKHVIIISPKNIQALLQDEQIDATSKIYLRYYQAHEKDVLSHLKIFKIIIQVVPVSESEICYSNYQERLEYRLLHFSRLVDTSTIQKTIILGENGNDAIVYGWIAEYYKRQNSLTPFEIVYKGQTGGGSTLVEEYKRIYNAKQEFCLCLVDSDRKAPDAELGETAKKIKKFNDQASLDSPNLKCHLHVLDSLELENLFPHEFYQKHYASKEFHEAHQRLSYIEHVNSISLQFHDYKKGLRSFDSVQSHITIDYWYPVISHTGLRTMHYNDQYWYITGFGDSILQNFIDGDKNETFLMVDRCRRTKNAWLDLGKLISSFIVSFPKKRAV